MMKIRINELARELEVQPKTIVDLLPGFGVTEKKTHSSSVDEDVAERIRERLTGKSPIRNEFTRPRPAPLRPPAVSAPRPGQILVGPRQPLPAKLPAARPIVPPNPSLVARLQQARTTPVVGQPQTVRPVVPARPSLRIPGQPIYRGPVRPGQPLDSSPEPESNAFAQLAPFPPAPQWTPDFENATPIPDGTEFVLAVAQMPVGKKNNLSSLVPLCTLDGTSVKRRDFPLSGRVFWALDSTTATSAIPGDLWIAAVETSPGLQPVAGRHRYRARWGTLRRLSGFQEILYLAEETPSDLAEWIRTQAPILEVPRKLLDRVFVRGSTQGVGPLRTQAIDESAS